MQAFAREGGLTRVTVSLLALVVALLGAGCATSYPEGKAPSYPLPACTREAVAAGVACVTAIPDTPDAQVADSVDESALRSMIEAPFLRDIGARVRPRLAVSLSGGGSKAAAVAMGALAGLQDSQVLDRVDAISSVSGGGYAAYFYYAQSILPYERGEAVASHLHRVDLFSDCVRPKPNLAGLRYDLAPALELKLKGVSCAEGAVVYLDPENESNYFQAFVKCTTDVLWPAHCSTQLAGKDDTPGVSSLTVVATVVTAPISWVANTLFDWGVNVSPSRSTYRTGIGLSFGSRVQHGFKFPPDHGDKGGFDCDERHIAKDADSWWVAETEFVARCTNPGGAIYQASPVAMTFSELRNGLVNAQKRGQRLPYWIINATAPSDRSVYGWFSGRRPNPVSDVFEMTAISQGSARYGFVNANMAIHHMNVLDAVSTAAAFFDANEQLLGKGTRAAAGIGMHLFNLDWGLDIRNYNVSDARATIHRLLPIPLYFLDSPLSRAFVPAAATKTATERERDRVKSSFIRLIDGGNGENLGLYSLLRRHARNVVVVDAAEDGAGQFDDLCLLQETLAKDDFHPELEPKTTLFERSDRVEGILPGTGTSVAFPRFLYFPGLSDFDKHCKQRNSDNARGYDLHHWSLPYPVLLGCARTSKPPDATQPCHGLTAGDSRLILVKPAFDYSAFLQDQWVAKKVLSSCWLPSEGINMASDDPWPLPCESAFFIIANSPESPDCPEFPQHSTAGMTAKSSYTLFGAYRELGRQYAAAAGALLHGLIDDDPVYMRRYDELLSRQATAALRNSPTVSNGFFGGRRHVGTCPASVAAEQVKATSTPTQ